MPSTTTESNRPRLGLLAAACLTALPLVSCAGPGTARDATSQDVEIDQDRPQARETAMRGGPLVVDGCDPAIGPTAIRGAAATAIITYETVAGNSPFARIAITGGADVAGMIEPRAGNGTAVNITGAPVSIEYSYDSGSSTVTATVNTAGSTTVWTGQPAPTAPGPLAPARSGTITTMQGRTSNSPGQFDIQVLARGIVVGFELTEQLPGSTPRP